MFKVTVCAYMVTVHVVNDEVVCSKNNSFMGV